MGTLTLNLSDQEVSVLHGLATEQELSQSQLMRQALRLYQHVHYRLKEGQKMAFVDASGNVIRQEIVGVGGCGL